MEPNIKDLKLPDGSPFSPALTPPELHRKQIATLRSRLLVLEATVRDVRDALDRAEAAASHSERRAAALSEAKK